MNVFVMIIGLGLTARFIERILMNVILVVLNARLQILLIVLYANPTRK